MPKKDKSSGLLASNGGLSDKFRAVLREVFARFDADTDGALSLKELEQFAVASKSGGDLSLDELKQLGKFFDTDIKGNITLKGFEQMYQMQTAQQAADTWRDLTNLGYTKSLDTLGPPPSIATPVKAAGEGMEELRSALAQLKTDPDNAAHNRRVGYALKAMGRDEAAAKSLAKADELENNQAQSTVNEID